MVVPRFKHVPPQLIADRWVVDVIAYDPDANGIRPSSELDLIHVKATAQWRGVGTGELVVSYADPGYALCVEGNYIILTDTISGYVWQGTIRGVTRNEGGDTPETKKCIIADLRHNPYARIITQAGLYSTQIVVPNSPAVQMTAATETLALSLVQQDCIARVPITGLRVSTSFNRGSSQTISVTGEPLGKKIEELLAYDDMGDEVLLMPDYTLVYQVLEGNDRTAGSQYPQIFSVDLDNVVEVTHEHGDSGHINAVWVMGKAPVATAPAGGGPVVETPRPMLWVTDDASIAIYGRLEATLDAASAVGSADLLTAGQIYLAQHPEKSQITFIARETAAELFGLQWTVGDLVTVERRDWGIQQNMRIQKIEIEVGNPELRTDFLPQTVLTSAEGAGAYMPENAPYRFNADGGMGHAALEFNLTITAGIDTPVPSWRSNSTKTIR